MRHFKISEFDSPDEEGSGSKMDKGFLNLLDNIRSDSGVVMKINSGYRTKKHNDLLRNASPNSSHMKGIAVDVHCTSSVDRKRLIFAALDNGVKRIGVAKTFIHLDIDNTKIEAIWVY